MKTMIQIIPAILSHDISEVNELVNKIQAGGDYNRIQMDFIDGEYADNQSLGLQDIKIAGYKDQIKFDAHLMVTEKNIEKYYEEAKKAGFDRIIVQMESISNPERYDGLAIDMHSPMEAIEPYLTNLNIVLVMGVEPGFGGQGFDNRIIESLNHLDRLRRENGYKYRICVDGGVQKDMLPVLEKTGVDEVAVGARRLLTSWN